MVQLATSMGATFPVWSALRSAVVVLVVVAGCHSAIAPTEQYRAAPPNTPSPVVAVLGDQQRTGTMEVWRERNTIHGDLVQQLARTQPQALVVLGDQVFRGDDNDDWAFFDRIMEPVRKASIPVFPMLGNHEYFGNNSRMREHVRARFPGMNHRYYTVVIDSVAYIMLDTNFDEYDADSAVYQLRWFKTMVRRYDGADSVRCIVVCGHHPPHTNSRTVPPEKILLRYFVPVAERSRKARLWLSGHCHAYERFLVNNITFVVSGGGGGPRQLLREHTDPRAEPDLYNGGTIRPFHFLTLRRQGAAIRGTMIPLRGSNAPADEWVTRDVRTE